MENLLLDAALGVAGVLGDAELLTNLTEESGASRELFPKLDEPHGPFAVHTSLKIPFALCPSD